MPRWTANVVWRCTIWLNVRICVMSARAVIDLDDDIPGFSSTSVSAARSAVGRMAPR